ARPYPSGLFRLVRRACHRAVPAAARPRVGSAVANRVRGGRRRRLQLVAPAAGQRDRLPRAHRHWRLMSLYEIPLTTIDGQTVTLDGYRGKRLLIVNVASRCGFTPQYKGLEELYRRRKDDLV